MIYDDIIVGSGISGLYYAHLLTKNYPHKKFLILESSDRIGGRVGQTMFHDTKIVYGAGVGRFDKDKLLVGLLDELGVKYNKYITKIDYLFSERKINILGVIEFLKNKMIDLDTRNEIRNDIRKVRNKYTFKEFALKNMSSDEYTTFMLNVGYSDFINADLYDTIYDYGFDDNVPGNEFIMIDWLELLEKISRDMDIRLNHKVLKINKKDDIITITTNQDLFRCKKIILAIPPRSLEKIMPDRKRILDKIQGQTFCRYYIKIDKGVDLVQNMTYTYPPIQKIIKMGDKGVYMISYSDNHSADEVSKMNAKDIEDLIYEITSQKIKIEDSLVFYFKNGTHYYKPLDSQWMDRDQFLDFVQNYDETIKVVGEAYSRNQGWCEGALESVRKIF
jgi:hypothetical protein